MAKEQERLPSNTQVNTVERVTTPVERKVFKKSKESGSWRAGAAARKAKQEQLLDELRMGGGKLRGKFILMLRKTLYLLQRNLLQLGNATITELLAAGLHGLQRRRLALQMWSCFNACVCRRIIPRVVSVACQLM